MVRLQQRSKQRDEHQVPHTLLVRSGQHNCIPKKKDFAQQNVVR
jgi:hypothetical protein